MYRQVRLHHEDTDFQRILWRNSPTDDLQDFKLKTVTYGTASAPYLAIKALQQLAHDEKDDFPEASLAVHNDFYVDDLMSGEDTIEKAKDLQSQLIQLLKRGGFQLRKWSSNYPEILDAVCAEDRETQLPLEIESGQSVKTLGLHWHPATDHFSFVVHLSSEHNPVTKRLMLSDICRLFDPLGWLAPVIIVAKIMMQKLWLLGIQWDEELPSHLKLEWMQFRNHLPLIEDIRINRWMNCLKPHSDYQLHGFCDASEQAYGAAVYLRVTSSDGNVSVNLLVSKTKVAPIKQISLPRLELCGAVLLAKLMRNVLKALKTPASIHAWTDSTIVLSWISGHPSRWKSFVANRVTEIQNLITPLSWNHVSSGDNPSDCAS